MCQAMESGAGIQEEVAERDLKKQLAATVRSIQWSYAIFWCASARQQGVLVWGDGYYNGDIKTRKTTQPMEFKADQMGLQRSEQLRELFESLSAGDSNQQAKRPSASLSPEDLTATEWYYLVCMSFTFGPGQGLPGKVLASNQHIWLRDAPFSDSNTFSRSLLAKSASIMTVACIPFMGGVLELGTTEEVSEDTDLIQQVTTSFWELSVPVSSEQSISNTPIAENDDGNMHEILDHVMEHTAYPENLLEVSSQPYALNEQIDLVHDEAEELNPIVCDELKIGSSDHSSNEYCRNLDDSLRMEGLNCASQIGSLNWSDCMSQSFVNPQRILSSTKGERIKNFGLDYFQEGNYAKSISLDLDGNETHYQRTLAVVLSNSKVLTSEPRFPRAPHESSFGNWRRGSGFSKSLGKTPQKMLKRLLVDSDWVCGGGRQMKPLKENGNLNRVYKSEADENCLNHVMSERRRREKLNEKFMILKSLVPSISKMDKASILCDTIGYIKELERRVEELEASAEIVELEGRGRRKHPDIIERTSDNYHNNNEDTSSRRKPPGNKRKACDIEEVEADCNHWFLSKDGAVDINVTVIEREITVEMQCPWRDGLLVEIVDAMSKVHLDVRSVKSRTVDNILELTLEAKIGDSVTALPGTIKRALQRVIGKF